MLNNDETKFFKNFSINFTTDLDHIFHNKMAHFIDIDDHSRFGLSCLDPLLFVLCSESLLNYLAFQSFDFDHI